MEATKRQRGKLILPDSDRPLDSPTRDPLCSIVLGYARDTGLPARSVDLVVTSPPYWKKRDYGLDGQIGQERTSGEFVQAIIESLREWRRVLRTTGSVFLNIGDSYHRQSLAGIPARIEAAALDDGWRVRNRIIWAKQAGMPEPARFAWRIGTSTCFTWSAEVITTMTSSRTPNDMVMVRTLAMSGSSIRADTWADIWRPSLPK